MTKNYEPPAPIITTGRYSGKRIDEIPNSYLRWMVTQDFPKDWLDAAVKKLSKSNYSSEYLSVSRHAYDSFSMRFLHVWEQANRSKGARQVGLGTFVAQMAEEAWKRGKDVSKHRHEEDGIVKDFLGIKWVFNISDHYPDYKDLITVMPSISKH